MSINDFKIASRLNNYTVTFVANEDVKKVFEPNTDIVLIDRNVFNIYEDFFSKFIVLNRLILITATEKNKTLIYASKVIESIMNIGVSKRTRIVSIGGGIVQDLSGFIASIIYRGLTWVYMPTTLLAQTDSCIGAKTSINFQKNKNILGTFYNPSEVILNLQFLNSLKRRDFLSGLGETIKLHIIGGTTDIAWMGKNLKSILQGNKTLLFDSILRSLKIKQGYIEEDEFDRGIRNMLNYGHCIGHAIETVSNYKIPHGQAVTLGMIWANRLANQRGLLSTAEQLIIENELLYPALEKRFKIARFTVTEIIAAMKKDKKRMGIDLVVVIAISGGGVKRIDDVKEDEIASLNKLWENYESK